MSSEIFDEIIKDIPKETKRFLRMTMDISSLIYERQRELRMNNKNLAKMMGIRVSTLGYWLGGAYNFSLEQISKIETNLGIELIKVNEFN